MLKATITILQILVGVYFLGNAIRQNPKFDAFLLIVENGYGGINDKLKDTRIREGVYKLGLMYGFLSFLAFLMLFLTPYVASQSEPYFLMCSAGFIIGLIGWSSISWCLQHRKMLLENTWFWWLMPIFPFFLAFLEKQTGISILWCPLDSLFKLLNSMGVYIELPTSVWSQAFIFCAILIVFMLVQYLVMWCISIPVLIITILMVLLIVFFARLVNLIAPKTAFYGFMVILFVALILVQNYILPCMG